MISISISCEASELSAMREVLVGLAKIGIGDHVSDITNTTPAHRPITAEDDAKIWDMYSGGMSVKDISEELTLPWRSVRSRVGLMTKAKAKDGQPEGKPKMGRPPRAPGSLGVKCSKCQSDDVLLGGHDGSGNRRYKCGACGHHFTLNGYYGKFPANFQEAPIEPADTSDTSDTLSESDQAILDLMKQGLPAIDIAAQLGRTIGGPWTPDAVRARIKVLREVSA